MKELKTDASYVSELQKQIDDLEIKLAFQEHHIEELNDALVAQQHLIAKLTTQMTFFSNKLKAMEPANIASITEETPPPHY